jgi:hypothetical protein
LVAVGLAVGKASAPLDAWFMRAGWAHPDLGRLLFFTDACAAGTAATYSRTRVADTISAWFFGTALICLAVRAARLDRCQPRCDLRHSSG